MSQSATRARLHLTRLDDRTVPSTVNVTTTARPFEFTATGTLTTTDQHGTDAVSVGDTTTSSVTLDGSIAYESNTTGATGVVTVTGTGTGTEPDGRGSYAQTLVGKLSFEDVAGAVSTTDPYTATVNWFTTGNGSGVELYGPSPATGTLDVSTFKLAAAWDAAGPTDVYAGNLTVTLANKTDLPTDLAFAAPSATPREDGTVDLDFTVTVGGNLMTAPSHTTAVTHVTATWAGGGKSESVAVDVPVYWNTGEVIVSADGLTPPEWAETLTVRIDAGQVVAESDEGNNEWTVTLADLAPPAEEPPVEEEPPAEEPPVAQPPADPPPAPPEPLPMPAAFNLVEGDFPMVEWRDNTGRVIGRAAAFEEYSGPATIATADVNGDGVLDVAIAAGVGGGPRVRVLDGTTGNVLLNFFAYDSGFRGGVNVALADVTGDGSADVIAGAGVGGGPHVRVFDGATGGLVSQFFAFNPDFRGGVRVAGADLDADGYAEVITGTGAGGGPVIGVFDGGTGNQRLKQYAGPEGSRAGVRVSAVTDANGMVIMSAETEGDGPARRFRSQLREGEPVLVELIDPSIPPPPVYTG